MSIKSELYYSVECDGEGCSRNAQEMSEFSAWKQADYAEMEATESGWAEVGGKHYCDECRAQFDCVDCGELKTECECKGEGNNE